MRKMKFISLITALSLLSSMFLGLTVRADEEAPVVPEHIVTSDSITFVWEPWDVDSGAIFYKVTAATNGAEIGWADISPGDDGLCRKEFTGLRPSTTYAITVWSINAGWGWMSERRFEATTTASIDPAIAAVSYDTDSIEMNFDAMPADAKNLATIYNEDTAEIVAEDVAFTGALFEYEGLEMYTEYTITIESTTGLFDPMEFNFVSRGYKVIEATSTSVTIQWQSLHADHGNFVKYEVDGDGLKDHEGGTLVLNGLLPNKTYEVHIVPMTGSWGWLPEFRFNVTTAEPAEPYLAGTEATADSITLTYANILPGEFNYMTVYEVIDGVVAAAPIIDNEEFEGTVYSHTGLAMGKTFKYILTPKDSAIGKWESVETEVTTATPELSVSRSFNSITVYVSNISDAVECTISGSSNGAAILMNNGEETDTFVEASYKLSGLTQATDYTFTVAPVDPAAGWGPLTIATSTIPEYKIEVTEISENSFTVAWVAVENSAAYKIVFGGNMFDITETSQTFSDLEPNTSYNVQVVALRNGDFNWHHTYSINVRTLAQVDKFTTTDIGANNVATRWPEVAGAAYFNVYEVVDGEEVLLEEGIDPVTRVFEKVWLKHNTTFTYVVKAFNEADEEIEITGFDNTLTFKTEVKGGWNNDPGEEYYQSTALRNQNVRHETYYSELMDLEVGYNIHIPANYDPEDTTKRYPVLYMLHALGGNENSWVSDYWGATYVDTLKSMGDDMFIVYPNNDGGQWYTDASNGLYYGRSTILYELIPHIDANYNTVASKEGRALDGFSMGGVGSLLLAFERPDMFNSVVTHSAAVTNEIGDFMSMNWGAHDSVFGWDVDAAEAIYYYDQEGIYSVYEKNKEWIEEEGMNIIMHWGGVDPVALLSNQRMVDTLSENPGVNLQHYVIGGYDHSSVYYDGGRMFNNLTFHRSNLDFSATTAAEKKVNIGSISTALGDVFIEKAGVELAEDAKLLVASYDTTGAMTGVEIVDVADGVKTDFTPVKKAGFVKVFLWNMGAITPVTESKVEVIY